MLNSRGDVYINELAGENCRLQNVFLDRFYAGEWISLSARPTPNGKGYWIVSAECIPHYRRRREFPTLTTAQLDNGQLAVGAARPEKSSLQT